MAQKLWEKNVQVNAEIDRFTVGRDREMDMYLAKYDVLGSMAHITMLESIGLLALLSLGVKHIHLGPTLPAFLSPNVAKVLVEQFGIGGITTPEADMKLFGIG